MFNNMDTNASPHQSQVFLPYDLSYIPEELQKRAKTELFEDEETKGQSLELLKSMLKDETDLHWYDDDFYLIAFLRARKFDVKRTFNLVKNNYVVMTKYDEIYGNFNYDDVKRTLQENSLDFLPYRDEDGCVIAIFRVGTWNPHNNSMADVLRALTCGVIHALTYPATQIAGVKAIIDCSSCGLWKIPYLHPTYLWVFAQGLQNCFPCRFKEIHVVNEVSVARYIWPVFKRFLNKKLRDRFHFHGKRVKELHESFSPKVLPAEFGGELPAFNNSEWSTKMAESADFFSLVFSHGYNKKRK